MDGCVVGSGSYHDEYLQESAKIKDSNDPYSPRRRLFVNKWLNVEIKKAFSDSLNVSFCWVLMRCCFCGANKSPIQPAQWVYFTQKIWSIKLHSPSAPLFCRREEFKSVHCSVEIFSPRQKIKISEAIWRTTQKFCGLKSLFHLMLHNVDSLSRWIYVASEITFTIKWNYVLAFRALELHGDLSKIVHNKKNLMAVRARWITITFLKSCRGNSFPSL